MTYPVLVSLTGYTVEGDGSQDSPIKLTTRGMMSKEGSLYTLEYDETQTDEDSGAMMTQHIVLTMQTNRVQMTRMGDFGTTMVFVKDKRFEGDYHTPYGDLSMAVFATKVSMTLSEKKGSLHLQYQLSVQGQYSGMHDLRMEYRALEQ